MNLAQIVWDVSPTIVKIGSFELRWYGLLFAFGFIVGFQIMTWIFKVEKRNEKDLDSLLLTMIISVVLGARIGHYVFYEGSHFFENPGLFLYEMLIPPYAGLASHGAAFAVLIGLYLFVRKHKNYKYLWLTDRLAIISALGGAFIRFGNFMNSEIIGKPTDGPFGVIFKHNFEFSQVARHPSQLYEAVSYLFIFGILMLLYFKWREKTPNGSLTGLFFILVFGMRFILEFTKENQVDFENGMALNMGQILSIPAVLIGLYFFIKSLRKEV